MKLINTWTMLVASTVLLAACSTPVPPAPEPTPAPVVQPEPPKPAPAVQPTVAPVVIPAHLDPKSAISTNRSVYFDYDMFVVKTEFNALLETQAKYLAANPKLAIRVEGNADERGGSEYNLALGQKRAQAVVNAMKILGVKEAQMEAVSWGKEKPKAEGHNEAAWSQNRRVDLVYPSK
jgi:peptidoglycan-associated lipoprotein